ncbi:DUF1614 domain-containing protein [Calorimonas adulescens]|uniref:DUF1614 domain-containing protein n=1 Tax=Calorimonas adulescens TaxID=2606906 RepID=A0A5D8QBI2_9THEO|nr:DUF1614 domain-containing protein [Calorimonas adulescens]TZE81970.1 DUF1614 domain-containing protein [Calorimonas adulescens]
MPLSYIILMIIAVLILFGIAHRVLDRLGLTDTVALVFIIAILAGSFIPDIRVHPLLSINIGGAVIPFILSGYVFFHADSSAERIRSILGAIISGIAVFALGIYLPDEPASVIVEPLYAYAVACGLISYMIGRSRKAAFISGAMGIIISDIIQWVVNIINNIPGTIRMGGAGFMDAVIISSVIAVLLVEVIGETREKLQGGTSQNKSQETSFSGPARVNVRGGNRNVNKGKR